MSHNEIIEALQQQEKKLNEKAETIRKAIEILTENLEETSTEETSTNVKGDPGVQLGTSAVIKNIFDEYSKVDWTPPALRDELKKMKDKGLLKSKAKDLLASVNSPLQKLVLNGYVNKTGSGLNTKYRRSIEN